MGKKAILIFFFCTAFMGPILASSVKDPENRSTPDSYHPMGISPQLDQAIKAALDDLYNLKYAEGLNKFQALKRFQYEHPLIAYGIGAAEWWRLSVLVLEPDPKESEAFLNAVDKCIQICRSKIKAGDPTGEAHLALGGIQGLYGRWLVTNRSYIRAYFKGKDAYKNLVKGLQINPHLLDAYMGKGIFDYYVATLPRVIRFLAFLGMQGNKEEGLRELHLAAEQGLYSEVPTKLFLIDIYARNEGNPEKSLEILDTLKEKYPISPFIHILETIAYFNYGSIENLEGVADRFKRYVESGKFPKEFSTQAHFAQGLVYMKKKEWENAAAEFTQAINVQNKIDAFYAWSMLYRGYAYDALGRREDAKKDYKSVLDQLRRWESHDNAKKRLRHPFEGTNEDISKITL